MYCAQPSWSVPFLTLSYSDHDGGCCELHLEQNVLSGWQWESNHAMSDSLHLRSRNDFEFNLFHQWSEALERPPHANTTGGKVFALWLYRVCDSGEAVPAAQPMATIATAIT